MLQFVRLESSGAYELDGEMIGTYRLKDLKEGFLNRGICLKSPGRIVVEFNDLFTFEEIEIKGYCGSKHWSPENGNGAKILTSVDKIKWKEVGVIPQDFGLYIISVKLVKSTAKFIKFQHTCYLGLGFLKIKHS